MGLIANLKAKVIAGVSECPICHGKPVGWCRVCHDLNTKYPPGHPFRRRNLERRLRKYYGRKT